MAEAKQTHTAKLEMAAEAVKKDYGKSLEIDGTPSQYVPDKSSTRGRLYQESPKQSLDAALKDIDNQITVLEQLERSLAERYGLDEDFDSVDVFQIAKARALATNDGQSGRDMHHMDRLYQLRSHRAKILGAILPAS